VNSPEGIMNSFFGALNSLERALGSAKESM
jgi:hypothetical protein